MENCQNFAMMGKVEVDESYFFGKDDKALGRNEGVFSPKVVEGVPRLSPLKVLPSLPMTYFFKIL